MYAAFYFERLHEGRFWTQVEAVKNEQDAAGLREELGCPELMGVYITKQKALEVCHVREQYEGGLAGEKEVNGIPLKLNPCPFPEAETSNGRVKEILSLASPSGLYLIYENSTELENKTPSSTYTAQSIGNAAMLHASRLETWQPCLDSRLWASFWVHSDDHLVHVQLGPEENTMKVEINGVQVWGDDVLGAFNVLPSNFENSEQENPDEQP